MQKIFLLEQEIDRNREHFWVIGLDTKLRILFIELVSLGTINKTIVEPMEVFSFALQKRAARIIAVHNHPSGDLKPSAADKDTTDRLIQTGRIVNCPLEDHLIITETKYVSFVDLGLMAELGNNARSKYYLPEEPYYHYKKIIRGIVDGVKEIANSTAADLKKAGVPKDAISQIKQEMILSQTKKQILKFKKIGLSDEILSEASGLSVAEIKKM